MAVQVSLTSFIFRGRIITKKWGIVSIFYEADDIIPEGT